MPSIQYQHQFNINQVSISFQHQHQSGIDREKVFKGLKKTDTDILDGMRVYYNFTKKHDALKDRTPAQA